MEVNQETFDSLPWEIKIDILGKYSAPEFLHAYEVTFGHDKLQHLAYEEDIVEYVLREYYSCDSGTKSIFLDVLNGKEEISASVRVPVDKNNLLRKICRAIKKYFHAYDD